LLNLNNIQPDWTLFLDRDGVINHEKRNDYIHTWEEFKFYDGVLEAMEIFAKHFKRIIIVTNQKGVGKGLTKEAELINTHQNMQAAIENANGRIDAIFYCKDLEDDSPNRKPQSGMGLQAKAIFNDIDFNKAIMVGNTLSDMKFGRNLGVNTIFLPTTRPEVNLQDKHIDAVYQSLLDFAQALQHT
jgi:D-glycero-D-manno-heptose 1,7-bisphosphate phosphatase